MDDDRKNGMGIVIEYANRTVSQPDETIPIVFGKINGGQGASTAGPSTAPASMKTRRRGNCGKASAIAWSQIIGRMTLIRSTCTATASSRRM
jgi:hypothetical protein